jgi:hypothetical protein
MKKSIFVFSRMFLVLGLCWISIISNSQNLKLTKTELKEARKAEKVNNYKTLDAILESKRFVFEADYRSVQALNLDRVSQGRNYIRIDSLIAFVQFEKLSGKPKPLKPWERKIDSWELYKNDKKLSYDLKFKIIGVTQYYYMSIDYYSDAKLRIGNYTYYGSIKQL